MQINFYSQPNRKQDKLLIGFSIYNVYNQKNISHKRYNPYTSQVSVSNVFMLGITPSINLKANF